MTNHPPQVKQYMTPSPHTVRSDLPLAEAHRIMREHQIRHLPVLSGGELCGIVSQRDLHLIETLQDVDPEQVPVEDAMSQDVYTVSPDAPLQQVAAHMAQHRIGSAVVVDGMKVVGIFTSIDALAALADLLARQGS
ncbi:MAG: CBS domain-containing protein [Myxococcales bacterium]|nr:CBS domain-containing protein [Myxococcota bacterium]MDW8282881.1 CBS domain-containing protein [Myxococcales bacterium]